ncbi:TfuA-like protein [Dongia sp. agr-C8]
MGVVVFAGPSLYGVDPRFYNGLCVQPPAACGDILKAADRGAAAIGLIDGVFENTPAVWHKEILAALDAGIAVYGAASMGALRAAECCGFGMIGLGKIFEDYRSGRRSADADVAILHAPAELGFRPLTEALVDVEETIAALGQGLDLSGAEVAMLTAAARRLHYKERDWPAIMRITALDRRRAEQIDHALPSWIVRRKQRDALLLLQRMQAIGPVDRNRSESTFTFHRTLTFDVLRDRLSGVAPV